VFAHDVKKFSQGQDLTLGLTAQERRTEPRFPFTASVEAVHLQADSRLNGRISDLGRGGCYVDTINPFPVGADVKIRIAKGNASLVAEGKVLYAASGMGMGLAFTRIDPERIVVLEMVAGIKRRIAAADRNAGSRR
jgi:PilZ domain